MSPVFVVGPSRSGTSLMVRILNSNGELWMPSETGYFDVLRVQAKNLKAEAVQEACEDYFLKLSRRAIYDPEGKQTGVPFELGALRELAQQLGGRPDDYFEAFCRLNAERIGSCSRWGEKTPRHTFRIDDILEAFPSAKIIVMVRDPRAVVCSYRDMHKIQPSDPLEGERLDSYARGRVRLRRSYHPLLSALIWRWAMRAGQSAAARYGEDRVRLQRYEALVTEPEKNVAEICAWLDLPYSPTMLSVDFVRSSSLAPAGSGIKPEAATRWRNSLTSREIAVVESACKRPMRALGYEPYLRRRPRGAVPRAWLELPWAAANAFLANRTRIPRVASYAASRLGLAGRG
ncbi:MAG TPA: sulfotransferase [Gaiellaceae bacterium]|nr:sulfotransferase [Gaiellaceae bacterium]